MTITELRQNIYQRLEKMEEEKLNAVADFLDNLDTSSSSQEIKMSKSEDETRKQLIKSLRGMASHSTFSSDEFIRQKHKDIDLEERNW